MSNKDNTIYSFSDFSDSRFDVLMQVYLEGKITEKDADTLRDYLKRPEYVKRFVMVCKQEQLVHDIISSGAANNAESSAETELEVLRQFAMYENNAPSVEKELPKPDPVVINTVKLPERPHRDKFSLLTILATAAIVLLALIIRLTPTQQEPKAAILSDTCKVCWTGHLTDLQIGNNIFTNEKVSLSQGLIELKTDRDVTVIIEGPAEFEFKTTSELQLNYGHIYSKVMKQGAGFTVKTPNAMIVDLGTEFSIKVDRFLGSTQVQMYKGSAVISNNQDESGREILKTGIARAVDNQGVMSDIPFEKNCVLNRTLSGYEKKLEELHVSRYMTFNNKTSWVNNYVGRNSIKDNFQYYDTYTSPFSDQDALLSDSALYFNSDSSVKSYAQLHNMPEFDKGSFTIALWFKQNPDQPGPRKQYLVSNYEPATVSGWRIGMLDNKLFIRMSEYSAQPIYQLWMTNDQPLSEGWHSVVMVADRSNSTVTGYLDGNITNWAFANPEELKAIDSEYNGNTLSKKLPKHISISTDTDIHLGIRPKNLMCQFSGWIYDMAVWNSPLNADKIKQLYSKFPLEQDQNNQ